MKNQYAQSLDLHGLAPETALEIVRKTVESGRFRGKRILIVHGCGRGILREKVRSFLRSSRAVREVCPGEDFLLPGSSGVTAVEL